MDDRTSETGMHHWRREVARYAAGIGPSVRVTTLVWAHLNRGTLARRRCVYRVCGNVCRSGGSSDTHRTARCKCANQLAPCGLCALEDGWAGASLSGSGFLGSCQCGWRMKKPTNPNAVPSTFRPKNALFAALEGDQLQRVTRDLECVPLRLGQVLYESGELMTHAYFPIDCIVSLLYVMENGESAEIAVVGHEGMVGIALFMGGESTMSRAVVQNAGHAYRMPSGALIAEFRRGEAFSQRLLTFALALINQMTQSGACNRHHTLDQQLCRWILMSLDRLPNDRIEMTEKLIGNMLGVTAPAAGVAAAELQAAGLADYADGVIRIRDRAGIERRSCECYAAVKRENDRLLPPARASAEAFEQATA